MSPSRATLLIQALLVSLSCCQSTVTVAPRSDGLQYGSCSDVIASCPFAQPECVQNYCSLSCPDTNKCCSSSESQGCLIRANLQSPCVNMDNSVVLCFASSYLPDCLCYDTKGTYAPDGYDNMAQSCYAIATSASTGIVSYLTGSNGALGFCTKFAGPSPSTAVATASNPPAGAQSPPTTTTATPVPKAPGQASSPTSATAKSSANLMVSSTQAKSLMIAAAALVMLVT